MGNRFKLWLEKRKEKKALKNIRMGMAALGHPLLNTDDEIKEWVQKLPRHFVKTGMTASEFSNAIKRCHHA
jgi:hypothetical protein